MINPIAATAFNPKVKCAGDDMDFEVRFFFFLDTIVDFLKKYLYQKCENNGVCDEKTNAYCRCTIAFYGNNMICFFVFDWC